MSKKRKRNFRHRKDTRQKSEIFNLVYFFIPLRIPLRIPDGQIFQFNIQSVPFEDNDTLIYTAYDEEIGHHGLETSIMIRQIKSEQPNAYLNAAFEASIQALPSIQSSQNFGTRNTMSAITVTVVEAATRLRDTSEDPMTDAFDRTIESIRTLQRGYVEVTNHLIPLVSLSDMPFGIPYAIRTITNDETEPIWPSELSIFMTNLQDTHLEQASYSDELVDMSSVDRMFEYAYEPNSDSFGSFRDNWREARLASRTHQYSVACILSASASELLLREILTLLLWEEGMTPKRAAQQLCGNSRGGRGISSLISTEFHHRLGGSWNRLGGGIVTKYFELVLQTRNRIVHSGHVPSHEKTSQVLRASAQLHEFIFEQLIKMMWRYPLATLMTIGSRELDRRGLGKRIDQLVLDSNAPQSPQDNYMSYRFEVDRYTHNVDLRNGGELSGELSDADVALLIFPTGKEQWWLIDHEQRLACPAFAPKLTRGHLRSVRQARVIATSDDPLECGAVAMRILDVKTKPLADPPTWYPRHEVWPLERVDRFPSCPIPIYDESETRT